MRLLVGDPHALLLEEEVGSFRPGALERFSKWVWRRPAVAALLGATVLFTIAVIGAITLLAGTPADTSEKDRGTQAGNAGQATGTAGRQQG